MRIYFAHSFSEGKERALSLSVNPEVLSFLDRLQNASVEVCDPAMTDVPETDFLGRYNFCVKQIEMSDILVVDATHRLGVGVGAEMMLAKTLGIPVYTICPPYSHYKRRETKYEHWIHPFIFGISSALFDSLDECASALIVLLDKE